MCKNICIHCLLLLPLLAFLFTIVVVVESYLSLSHVSHLFTLLFVIIVSLSCPFLHCLSVCFHTHTCMHIFPFFSSTVYVHTFHLFLSSSSFVVCVCFLFAYVCSSCVSYVSSKRGHLNDITQAVKRAVMWFVCGTNRHTETDR